MAHVSERTCFHIKDSYLFSFRLSLPSVLFHVTREYTPSHLPIRIAHLKFAMSVIVVFINQACLGPYW